MTILKTSQAEWDRRWLGLAKYMATEFSKDPSRKVGAVLVSPDNSRFNAAYNGFPSRMSDDPALYANRDEKLSRVVHAEINARETLNERPVGWTLYVWPFLTCDRCAAQVIQWGVRRVVAPIYTLEESSSWRESLERARRHYDECGVIHEEIEFNPLGWVA